MNNNKFIIIILLVIISGMISFIMVVLSTSSSNNNNDRNNVYEKKYFDYIKDETRSCVSINRNSRISVEHRKISIKSFNSVKSTPHPTEKGLFDVLMQYETHKIASEIQTPNFGSEYQKKIIESPLNDSIHDSKKQKFDNKNYIDRIQIVNIDNLKQKNESENVLVTKNNKILKNDNYKNKIDLHDPKKDYKNSKNIVIDNNFFKAQCDRVKKINPEDIAER